MPGFRLTPSEIWAYVADAHTGIMTTLRHDGMPIAMPLWFAVVDETIYVNTRGKKLRRVANDPRASFLVESGEAWRDLKAVHFTGVAEIVEPDPDLLQRIEAETSRKYDRFRTDPADMPETIAAAYGAGMRWLRFTPDARVLSWNNRALMGDRPIDTGPPTGVTIETVVDADGTGAVRSSLPDAVHAEHVLVLEADTGEAAVFEQFGGTS